MALSIACQESIWLRRLLSDIQVNQQSSSTIYEDNIGEIELSKNPKFHNRTKHIDIYPIILYENKSNRKLFQLSTVQVRTCLQTL